MYSFNFPPQKKKRGGSYTSYPTTLNSSINLVKVIFGSEDSDPATGAKRGIGYLSTSKSTSMENLTLRLILQPSLPPQYTTLLRSAEFLIRKVSN
jgi:hypothetical protein